jgi:hypothetical protein
MDFLLSKESEVIIMNIYVFYAESSKESLCLQTQKNQVKKLFRIGLG